MAVQYSPLQKNALKRLDRAASLMHRDARYQKDEDRGHLREFLAKVRDRDLFDDELVYPHQLPMDVLRGVMRMSDPVARLDAANALFELPHAPKPKLGEEDMVAQAVVFRAINLLPLLHAKGFSLNKKQAKNLEQDLAMVVMKGPWPHVELILPDLWKEDRTTFLGELLRQCSEKDATPLGEVVKRLSYMPSQWATPDPSTIAAALAGMAWRRKANIQFDLPVFIDAGIEMCRQGWLDLDDQEIFEQAQGAPHEERLRSFMSQMRQVALQDKVVQPSATRSPARL